MSVLTEGESYSVQKCTSLPELYFILAKLTNYPRHRQQAGSVAALGTDRPVFLHKHCVRKVCRGHQLKTRPRLPIGMPTQLTSSAELSLQSTTFSHLKIFIIWRKLFLLLISSVTYPIIHHLPDLRLGELEPLTLYVVLDQSLLWFQARMVSKYHTKCDMERFLN